MEELWYIFEISTEYSRRNYVNLQAQNHLWAELHINKWRCSWNVGLFFESVSTNIEKYWRSTQQPSKLLGQFESLAAVYVPIAKVW